MIKYTCNVVTLFSQCCVMSRACPSHGVLISRGRKYFRKGIIELNLSLVLGNPRCAGIAIIELGPTQCTLTVSAATVHGASIGAQSMLMVMLCRVEILTILVGDQEKYVFRCN